MDHKDVMDYRAVMDHKDVMDYRAVMDHSMTTGQAIDLWGDDNLFTFFYLHLTTFTI